MSDAKRFVWYELMTTDAAAAEDFYRGVVGWDARDAGQPDMAYTLFTVADTPVAGAMALSKGASASGARPGWIGYVGVDDVDAYADRVARAGGGILRPPGDIPGVGRFAVIADPQGAALALFAGTAGSEPPPTAAMGTPGHAGWRELAATEWQSAFAFYAGLFGWTKADAVDMGAMGIYQVFAAGGEAIGGMMTKPKAVPAPYWLYYFNVDAIEAAKARVEAGGGQICFGPQEVPGGMWIVNCRDSQGATFALMGPRD